MAIKQALSTPLLQFLDVTQKINLITQIWPQLYLTTLEASSISQNEFQDDQLQQLIGISNELKLDLQEKHIVTSVVICSAGRQSIDFKTSN